MAETTPKSNKIGIAAGGLGALMLGAAQTRPEDAISNLAGWFDLFGFDHVPAFLATPGADDWGTTIGLGLMALSVLIWFLRRSHALRPKDALEPTKERIEWLALRDVIKHLAFDSQWAADYDSTNANALMRPNQMSEYKWQVDLSQAFLREAPNLASRGIRQVFGKKPDNGRTDIPNRFWQKAEISVVDMLATDFAGLAYIAGKEVYRDIIFQSADILEKWPKRLEGRKYTVFKKLIEPFCEGAEHRAAFNESAWGNIA